VFRGPLRRAYVSFAAMWAGESAFMVSLAVVAFRDGGAARAIWIVGAQKVVPDLSTALRRVEDHALPLENARAMEVYGQPSAINRLLILNAEPHPGRGTVLLLREPIGF
jgi:hypothetical protein